MKKLLSSVIALMILSAIVIVPQTYAVVLTDPSSAALAFADQITLNDCFLNSPASGDQSKTDTSVAGKRKRPQKSADAALYAKSVRTLEALCGYIKATGITFEDAVNKTREYNAPADLRDLSYLARPFVKFAYMMGVVPDGLEAKTALRRHQAGEIGLRAAGYNIPIVPHEQDMTYDFRDVKGYKLSVMLRAINLDILTPQGVNVSGGNQLMTRGEFINSVYKMGLVTGARGFFDSRPDAVSLYDEDTNTESLTFTDIPNLDVFLTSWDLINQHHLYSNKFDKKRAVYDAVNGLLKNLNDPYSSFMPPLETESFQDSIGGEIEGIGAYINKDEAENILRVISPIKDSPAERAGILPNDIITHIDGEDTAPLNINEAVEKIKGPKGTTVHLTITRNGQSLEVNIVRDVIRIESVTYEFRDDNIVYINMYQFGASTVREFQDAVNAIKGRSPRGIVLDLRNNPGGLLSTAVGIADNFVAEADKPVVQIAYANVTENINTTGLDGDLIGIPLVVLINKGSASASEILAGFIQDYQLGTIMGDTSFGKGVVQELIPFYDGSTLRITTARWLTPNGHSIDKQGITPDINILNNPDTPNVDEAYQAARERLMF